MTTQIVLKNARLSFPAIYEPKANAKYPNSPAKYSADILLTPDNPSWAEFVNLRNSMMKDEWGSLAEIVLKNITTDRKLRCYGGGDERISQKTMAVYEGYEGMKYVHATESEQPALFSPENKIIDPKDALTETVKFYGGCVVNALVSIWLQDNQHGRGVRCNLLALQWVKDGPKFSSRPEVSADAFGPVPAADDSTESFM